MNATTAKKIAKMSDTMLVTEDRRVWTEVECAVRHGVEVAQGLSVYAAAVRREMNKRNLAPLPL